MLITNSTQVSAETFDNEIVAIHFLKGTYFSIRGAAIAVWTWLQNGATESCLSELLAQRYGLDSAASQTQVEKTIGLFRQFELVIEVDAPEPNISYALDAGPEHFEEAVVEAFEDLQELIAIDPVHEVDPMQGWPHRPPAINID